LFFGVWPAAHQFHAPLSALFPLSFIPRRRAVDSSLTGRKRIQTCNTGPLAQWSHNIWSPNTFVRHFHATLVLTGRRARRRVWRLFKPKSQWTSSLYIKQHVGRECIILVFIQANVETNVKQNEDASCIYVVIYRRNFEFATIADFPALPSTCSPPSLAVTIRLRCMRRIRV
jgi:hypothetical protein